LRIIVFLLFFPSFPILKSPKYKAPTDVKDEWMNMHSSAFPLFEPVDEETPRPEGKDDIIDAIYSSTEGKKVDRNGRNKWLT
jgi:hypothetical protein